MKIEEKLDRITDVLFGASEFPGYYKEYANYRFPTSDIYLNEVRQCNFPQTRYNGAIEKEIFYSNVKMMRERAKANYDRLDNYLRANAAEETAVEEFRRRFLENDENRNYTNILRENKAQNKKMLK